jgi:hypothetical protein
LVSFALLAQPLLLVSADRTGDGGQHAAIDSRLSRSHAIDFLTTEAVLQAVPHFGAANRSGQVPVEQKRIAGSLIVGRHLGPVTLRLGITSTSHWQASIALPLQLLDHYGSGRMRRLP